MGNQPTKLRTFYKKLLKKKKFVGNQLHLRQHVRMATGCEEENTMLLNMELSRCGTETDDTSAGGAAAASTYMDEIVTMKRQIGEVIGGLRQSIDQIETEHKKRLQRCSQRCRSLGEYDARLNSRHEKLRMLENQMEECRLQSALINEKFKNCVDYLENYDNFTKAVQRETKKEDSFLRKILFKTAKRQFKKGQLNEAIETLCQLIIATGGFLSVVEMQLLFDVSKKKTSFTYEFYQRINSAVKQINDRGSKFVIDELWTSVLEDLRTECSESFDIIMKVNPEPNSRNQHNVISLKYLMTTIICGLWLQLTPGDHDEFEDIKDLLFDSLEKYIDTFVAIAESECDKREHTESIDLFRGLQTTLNELTRQYPIIAESKRMKKIVGKMAISTYLPQDNGILMTETRDYISGQISVF